jgi:hypothetical protein
MPEMPVPNVTPELQCARCRDWLVLNFKDHNFTLDGIRLLIQSGPVLRCPTCQNRKLLAKRVGRKSRQLSTRKTRAGFAVVTLRYDSFSGNYFPVFKPKYFQRFKNSQKSGATLTPTIPKQRFDFCQVPFSYDARDYYYLPGLYRSAGDGYLTPVFFNVEVLLKYAHHPSCTFDFTSDTYGTIHTKDGQTTAFGINRSGHVIMWLGDIARLPESEQHYLASENRNSDHDIGSHFYASQIEVEFTPPSAELDLLAARRKAMDLAFEKLGIKLAQLELEVIDVIKKIRRPIVWNDHGVGQTIENVNKLLVEAIDAEAIKQDLYQIDARLELSKLKSLKLFQKWLKLRCGFIDPSTVTSPLFVLYDLRVLSAHLLSNRKRKKLLTSVHKRLGLPADSSTVKEVYLSLISALKQMYYEIHSRIASL